MHRPPFGRACPCARPGDWILVRVGCVLFMSTLNKSSFTLHRPLYRLPRGTRRDRHHDLRNRSLFHHIPHSLYPLSSTPIPPKTLLLPLNSLPSPFHCVSHFQPRSILDPLHSFLTPPTRILSHSAKPLPQHLRVGHAIRYELIVSGRELRDVGVFHFREVGSDIVRGLGEEEGHGGECEEWGGEETEG